MGALVMQPAAQAAFAARLQERDGLLRHELHAASEHCAPPMCSWARALLDAARRIERRGVLEAEARRRGLALAEAQQARAAV